VAAFTISQLDPPSTRAVAWTGIAAPVLVTLMVCVGGVAPPTWLLNIKRVIKDADALFEMSDEKMLDELHCCLP